MTIKYNPTPLGYNDLTVTHDEHRRYYESLSGRKYPSITSVLSITSRDSIKAWRERVGEEEADRISHQAAWRGTRVHEAAEMYMQNIEPTIESELVRTGYKSLKQAIDKHVREVNAIEAPLFSDHLELGMRIDAAVVWDNGLRTLLDFKTSSKQKKREWIDNYFMQTTAGAIAFEERTGLAVPQVAIVIACDDSPIPQVFVEKRDDWVKPLLEVRQQYKDEFGI